MKNLKKLRTKIDLVDDKIAELLRTRKNLVKEASGLKEHIFDHEREKEILERNQEFKDIFQLILDHSKLSQLKKRNNIVLKELIKKPLIIAGPCSIESKEQIEKTCFFLKERGIKIIRGGIFKPRTSPESFQGLGIEGLTYLREAADKNNQSIIVEVMTEKQLELIYDHIDIIQVGSRNMSSFGLLKAVAKKTAKDHKPILLKRGMNAMVDEFLKAAAYLSEHGNNNILLCLRGIRTFEQINSELRNTPDLAAILELKQKTDCKIIFDPSHATGNRRYVNQISKAALQLGADGLMVEVHPDPETALCDGQQSLNFKEFEDLLRVVIN
ncbi:MAG: bifunctional 3-deoxy-7-phosphoheptulonate synthase/chorismate mutase [Candidatus Woesearchaeota archaeon]